MSIVTIASQCEFETTQAERGLMMAACVMGESLSDLHSLNVVSIIIIIIYCFLQGIFLSTYIWGYVTDIIGRRTVLLYGIFVSNILHFILMFVTSVWLFNIINLLCGIRQGNAIRIYYIIIYRFPHNYSIFMQSASVLQKLSIGKATFFCLKPNQVQQVLYYR